MKNLFLFQFLIAILFSSFTYGQTVDTFGSQYRILYEDLSNPNIDCFTLDIENNVVVRYETQATAYVKFKKDFSGEKTVEVRGIDNSLVFTRATTQGEVVLKSLPLNKDFALYTYDACNKKYKATTFSTKRVNLNNIGVSDQLYSLLAEWVQKPNNIKLYNLLKSNTSIPLYEKIYFIQNYLMNGVSFKDTDEGIYPPTSYLPPLPVPSDKDCKCTFVYKITGVPYPLPNGQVDSVLTNGELGEATWASIRKGAAKIELLSYDDKCVGSATKIRETIAEQASPYNAELNYHYLCIEYSTQLPKECECERNLRIQYRYDTKLSSNAYSGSTVFCGLDHGASASAEDWVVATKSSIQTATTVLDAGRARVGTVCSTNFNENFFIDIAKLAVGIYFATQAETINLGAVNLIIDQLQTILNTSYNDNGPDCDSYQKSETLIYNKKEITIKANDPTTIALNSYFRLEADGYTKFNTNASIISDFYLSVIEPGGWTDESRIYCCSDKYASWLSAGFKWNVIDPFSSNIFNGNINYIQSPKLPQELRDEIGSHVGLYGPWDDLEQGSWFGNIIIPTDCGEANFDVRECEIRPNGRYSNDAGDVNLNNLFVYTHEYSVNLGGLSDEKIIDFEIYNLDGRLLKYGKIYNKEELLSVEADNIAAGMYFVKFRTPNQLTRTLKFIVNY